MAIIGKLLKTAINTFILNTVEKRSEYNINGETYTPSGDDSPGLPDDRVLIIPIDGSGKNIIAGSLTISQGAEPGEKILYSRDANGNVKAKIYFQKDGKLNIETDDQINVLGSKKIVIDGTQDVEIKSDANIVLQDGTDFAVRYNELKTQLDQLKTDFNNFITSYNSHVHTVTTAVTVNNVTPGTGSAAGTGNGSAAATGSTGVPTTVDFSNTKVANINVPGVGE
jgi:hypothetical protein